MESKDVKKINSLSISPLQWDSSFFNLQIGKMEVDLISNDQMKDIMTCLENSRYDLVYLFANVLDEPYRMWVEDRGILKTDVNITYQKHISEPVPSDNDFIEEYKGNVTSRLLQLTYDSGHKSRFKKDPYLNHRFRDMYKIWIEKSVIGDMADAVLVANMDGSHGGFVTIKKHGEQGTIGLIAVDKDLRGKGIGSALLNEAEKWCINAKCRELFVSTQKENQQACRLYERNGFSVFSSQHIYHLYSDKLFNSNIGKKACQNNDTF